MTRQTMIYKTPHRKHFTDWATPTNNQDDFRCSRRVTNACPTSGACPNGNNHTPIIIQEQVEDTKAVIRSSKSKDRQHNDQKWSTKHYTGWATQIAGMSTGALWG